MRIEQISRTTRLWMEAVRSRWSLRQASGDGRWQLALHMTSWLRLCVGQTRWLHSLHAREAMWRAAQADPRLYERWHRPYISTHFSAAARRRIVNAHYDFVMRRFPAWLAERLVLGGGARLTTLRLEDAADVHLHLRKPSRADAGELSLLLLSDDKDVLASCILTFDRRDSITIGALRGAGPHAPFEATREFIRGSHGLHPKDLLMSLVRELAALHGLKRIRAVTAAACVGQSGADADGADVEAAASGDAFWEAQGGVSAGAGCHALPLSLIPAPCAEGPRSRRERQQRSEAFRRKAAEVFAAALRRSTGAQPAAAETAVPREGAPTPAQRFRGGEKHPAVAASLLAAGP
ncbi:DUF535 family protein [Rhodanobacter sp. IGA1.0]|uniref:DUF535 family protein n=1 Tax=Rhodanobacter sp. IGA1.0 TaxID=3158582 RepID=A0AAU7QJ36_9GAMM